VIIDAPFAAERGRFVFSDRPGLGAAALVITEAAFAAERGRFVFSDRAGLGAMLRS